MPSAFVPFLPSGGKVAAPRPGAPSPVTADSAAASSAFAALVPNATNSNAPAPNPSGLGHSHPGKPTISLKKDGDRVTHIRVECACGQVVELECAY